MWTSYLTDSSNQALKIVSDNHEVAASVIEFVLVLESIKYIDFLKLTEKDRLVDVIDKLKFVGVSEVLTDELNTYRLIRNGICHNKDYFSSDLNDLDYFKEHTILARNIINLIIRDITEKGIDVDALDSAYQKHLKEKKKKREERLKNNTTKGLNTSSIFAKGDK